jgi:hypothetical protein
MDDIVGPLRIESRFKPSRNILPIYNTAQLLCVLGLLGTATLLLAFGYGNAGGIGGGFGAAFITLFADRPRMMLVSPDQATAIEAALDREGKYSFSPTESLWLPNNAHWWSHWPHYSIEITNMDGQQCVFANAGAVRRVKAFLENHATI